MPAKKAAAGKTAAKKSATPVKKTAARKSPATKTARKVAAKKPAPVPSEGLRLAIAAARLAEDGERRRRAERARGREHELHGGLLRTIDDDED